MLSIETHPETKRVDVVYDGDVTKADYERIRPVLDEFIDEQGEVRLLVEIREFDDVGLQAIGEDLELTTRHLDDFEKVAFVADAGWQRSLVSMMDPVAPAEVRAFDRTERAAAEAWLDA